MKMLVARIAAAFAVVALATPAFPCGAHKTTTTAEKKADEKAPVATARDAKDGKIAKAAAETRTDQVKASATAKK